MAGLKEMERRMKRRGLGRNGEEEKPDSPPINENLEGRRDKREKNENNHEEGIEIPKRELDAVKNGNSGLGGERRRVRRGKSNEISGN